MILLRPRLGVKIVTREFNSRNKKGPEQQADKKWGEEQGEEEFAFTTRSEVIKLNLD